MMPAPQYGSGQRYRQLGLLLDTLRCLTSDWYRVEELGDYLEVSRRTAYRLVRVLVDAGMPISTRQQRGWPHRIEYRLDRDWWRTATPRRGRVPARERRG